MKIFKTSIAALALQLLTTGLCRAQSDQPAQYNLKTPPANIAVDGDLKEWNDSLSFYSSEEHITYMITNSKDTLYLAIKIYDRTEVARVLNAGLTFSVDTRGKKKESYSITYPLNVQGSTPLVARNTDNEAAISQDDRDELLRERLTTLRGIKLVGFKDIEDDMITTSNTYGFQAAVNYDSAGDLIYEEAIPLKFLHSNDAGKTLWAFNIKINGIQRPRPTDDSNSGSSGRGGMGGGGRHGGGGGGKRSGGTNTTGGELANSIDFWGKFYLAK